MKKKIIYIHGLGGAKEQSRIYTTIKEYYKDNIIVLAPEVPHNPLEAKKWIKAYLEEEKPDLIISSSMGSFYVLQNNAFIPTIIINPAMFAYDDLLNCFGVGYRGEFKPGRSDGKQSFILDSDYFSQLKIVTDEYKELLKTSKINKLTYGVFARNDELFKHFDDYVKNYNRTFNWIEDVHHISIDSVKRDIIPIIDEFLGINLYTYTIDDDFKVLEFYLENCESIYFEREDILKVSAEYERKIYIQYPYFEEDDECLEEENTFNYAEIIISKSARKMVPFMSMGIEQDMEKQDNFSRLLDHKDITWLYFYKGFKCTYGRAPYEYEGSSSKCNYYLDDEGNLHLELRRIK